MADDHHSQRSTDIFLTDIDNKKKSIKTANMKHRDENEEDAPEQTNIEHRDATTTAIHAQEGPEIGVDASKNVRCDSIINTEIDQRDMVKRQRKGHSKFDWIYDNHVHNSGTRNSQIHGYSQNHGLSLGFLQSDQQESQEEANLRNYQYFYDSNFNHAAQYNSNAYYIANYSNIPNFQGYNVAYSYYNNPTNASKFKQTPMQDLERRAFDPMVFYAEDSEVERRYMKKNKINTSLKPPYSYSQLITKAIEESENGILTLSEIYKYIKDSFEYYNKVDNTWQNSIRHNLSLNKVFKKIARPTNKPGKGGYWTIDYDYIANGTPYKRYKRKSDSHSYSHSQVSSQGNSIQYNESCSGDKDHKNIDCSSETEKSANNRM